MNKRKNPINSFFKHAETKEDFWRYNYRKICQHLTLAAYSFCPQKTKDIVAEVMEKLCKTDFQVLLALDTPRAYLVRAARNQSFSHLRKRKLTLVGDFESNEEEQVAIPIPSYNISKQLEYSMDLKNAMKQLPSSQSEVFRMKMQGLSIKEIANELSLTEGAVRGRLQRARQLLRSLLK